MKENLMTIKEILGDTINLNEPMYKVLEQMYNEWSILPQEKKDIIINALCDTPN